MLARSDRFHFIRSAVGVVAGLLALVVGVRPAGAFFRWTPSATRLTSGTNNHHSWGRSWGYFIAFSSTENLDPTKSTGGTRQVFIFNVLNYACRVGQPELRSPDETTPPCPTAPQPYIRQITSGPGNADNPSVSSDGQFVAFEANGEYLPDSRGASHRQIFLWSDGVQPTTIRVTDSDLGDSVHPTLNGGGGKLAFESTAPLFAGTTGIKQVFLYNRGHQTLEQVTNGDVESTRPMLNKIGTQLTFQSAADLLNRNGGGPGADTGVIQIFYLDKSESDVTPGTLHQLTDGNGQSQNPFMEERLPNRIFFDSYATDLPGAPGPVGRQVYAAGATGADTPIVERITNGPGDCFFPAVEPAGERVVFICNGDRLSNGTTGNRLFAQLNVQFSTTLYQITGRGTVDGPISANLPWFVGAATDNDMAGTGNCGTNLYLADYWPGHYYEPGHARLAATLPHTSPAEPTPGPTGGGCDDGNSCTNDICQSGQSCAHTSGPDGQVCGGGDICTGIPACQAGRCERPAGLACDDNDPCTTNRCNAALSKCEYTVIPPTQGGVQCHQVQVSEAQLGPKPTRLRERLNVALQQITDRPTKKAKVRAVRKAQKLAARLAAAAGNDSATEPTQLSDLLAAVKKLLQMLSELLPLLAQSLGK